MSKHLQKYSCISLSRKKLGGDREEEKRRDVFKDYVSQQTEVYSDLSDLRKKW